MISIMFVHDTSQKPQHVPINPPVDKVRNTRASDPEHEMVPRLPSALTGLKARGRVGEIFNFFNGDPKSKATEGTQIIKVTAIAALGIVGFKAPKL